MNQQDVSSITGLLKSIRFVVIIIAVLLSVITAICSIDFYERIFGDGFSVLALERFYKKANKLITEEKYEEVRKLAEDRISEKPDEPYGYWFLGLSYFKTKKWSDAIGSFEKLLVADPGWKEKVEPYLDRAKSNLPEQDTGRLE